MVAVVAGIEGNEGSDQMAKAGAINRTFGPEPMVGIAPATIKLEIARWGKKIHAERWRVENTCRQSREFFPDLVPTRISKKLINLPRADLRLAIGLLTGHIGVNYMLHKMGISDTPQCELCNTEIETVRHVLENCPSLMDIRRAIYGKEIVTLPEIQKGGLARMVRFAKRSERFL